MELSNTRQNVYNTNTFYLQIIIGLHDAKVSMLQETQNNSLISNITVSSNKPIECVEYILIKITRI